MASAPVDLPANVRALVAKHAHLSVTPAGRVRCALTGHECKPDAGALRAYLAGAALAKARRYSKPLDAVLPRSLRPLAAQYLRPHKRSDKLLFCALTQRTINRIPEEVVAHLCSRRFEAAVKRGGPVGGGGEEGGEAMDEGAEDEAAGGAGGVGGGGGGGGEEEEEEEEVNEEEVAEYEADVLASLSRGEGAGGEGAGAGGLDRKRRPERPAREKTERRGGAGAGAGAGKGRKRARKEGVVGAGGGGVPM